MKHRTALMGTAALTGGRDGFGKRKLSQFLNAQSDSERPLELEEGAERIHRAGGAEKPPG